MVTTLSLFVPRHTTDMRARSLSLVRGGEFTNSPQPISHTTDGRATTSRFEEALSPSLSHAFALFIREKMMVDDDGQLKGLSAPRLSLFFF